MYCLAAKYVIIFIDKRMLVYEINQIKMNAEPSLYLPGPAFIVVYVKTFLSIWPACFRNLDEKKHNINQT